MKTKRHFTSEARRKALETRKLNLKVFDPNKLEVFVLRDIKSDKHFVFEIRKFGGVVVYKSNYLFAEMRDAFQAGSIIKTIIELCNMEKQNAVKA